MMISRLSDADINVLSSGQIITDLISIVKELVENSLDAHATSITVTVDGLGLDQIIVRDNGDGIPEGDRQHMASRCYTSKLSSFNDITLIRSYGFRGEALASLAEVTQSLKIVTRSEFDQIATSYELDSRGHIKASRTSADPRGTTVTVTKPWYRIPVRRQKFRRESHGLRSALREVMRTYSFVHPPVRFQLVIKALKRGESAVVETQPSRTSVQEALASAFGPSVTNMGKLIRFEHLPYRLTAFLPVPEAQETSGTGHYVYVDSRPVSCARDTPKEILRLIKTHISKHCPSVGNSALIFLDISCPGGSYDPNVEPSKNSVFFCDSDIIMKHVDAMLTEFYGPVALPNELSSTPCKATETHTAVPDVITPVDHQAAIPSMMLMNSDTVSSSPPTKLAYSAGELNNSNGAYFRGSPLRINSHQQLANAVEDSALGMNTTSLQTTSDLPEESHIQTRRSNWAFNMFDADEICMDAVMEAEARTQATSQEDFVNVQDFVADRPALSNPWTIAKLNSTNRQSRNQLNASDRPVLKSPVRLGGRRPPRFLLPNTDDQPFLVAKFPETSPDVDECSTHLAVKQTSGVQPGSTRLSAGSKQAAARPSKQSHVRDSPNRLDDTTRSLYPGKPLINSHADDRSVHMSKKLKLYHDSQIFRGTFDTTRTGPDDNSVRINLSHAHSQHPLVQCPRSQHQIGASRSLERTEALDQVQCYSVSLATDNFFERDFAAHSVSCDGIDDNDYGDNEGASLTLQSKRDLVRLDPECEMEPIGHLGGEITLSRTWKDDLSRWALLAHRSEANANGHLKFNPCTPSADADLQSARLHQIGNATLAIRLW